MGERPRNVWDVTEAIQSPVRGQGRVDLARLADPVVPLDRAAA